MGRLVIASNRTAVPGQPRAGGLAVALADALTERGGGAWFGWSGEVVNQEATGVRTIREADIEFALADLTRAECDGYYHGFANKSLWPVFHYRIDLAAFDESDFQTYEAVNRRFGRLLAHETRPGDTVWVHDYHFLLLGEEMRAAGWEGPLGFFLHIPFPAPEVLMAVPQHQALVRGLCAFDLVGFQAERDVANFRRYLVEQAGGELLDDGRLFAFGRVLEAAAFPIGTDPDDIKRLAEGEEGRDAATRLARTIADRALVIGVDRMDYSKGLPNRMEAFGRLLDEHAELHNKVSFVQIAPPSREAVEAYQALRTELDRLAGQINGDYADLDWTPIRYLARSYSRGALAGIYRLARVGLVTPLYDGMNLVAKEFVAAQEPDDPGVLVLSEFAGAAEQMREAILVNPHDIGGMASAVHDALEMPVEERRERWEILRRGIAEQSIAWWRRGFLDALDASFARKAREEGA
ncbi:MAG TPA: trehalose-6-phosphate synthase [Mesorhizobium sp.]|jgi:trehalose 6-phosphate synthase|nr:trehalose-6-phosphate synthase [Mesorhizobium sp.]